LPLREVLVDALRGQDCQIRFPLEALMTTIAIILIPLGGVALGVLLLAGIVDW
jgi:hypothetical protein